MYICLCQPFSLRDEELSCKQILGPMIFFLSLQREEKGKWQRGSSKFDLETRTFLRMDKLRVARKIKEMHDIDIGIDISNPKRFSRGGVFFHLRIGIWEPQLDSMMNRRWVIQSLSHG